MEFGPNLFFLRAISPNERAKEWKSHGIFFVKDPQSLFNFYTIVVIKVETTVIVEK